jgi:hypothetical protein
MIACAVINTDEIIGTGIRGANLEAVESAERALSRISVELYFLDVAGMMRLVLQG